VHSQNTAWAQYGNVLECDFFEHKQALNKGNAGIRCADDEDSGIVVDFNGVEVFFGDHRQ
jgi:hypothetical protein